MNFKTAKSFLKWVNGPGADYSVYAVAFTGFTMTSLTYLPNTFFLYKYKEYKENNRFGSKAILDPELEDKFKKCLDMIGFNEKQRKGIELFCVRGIDMFHTGSLSSRFGAAFGIPEHFSYKTPEDVDLISIKLNLKTINDDNEAVIKLKDSLVLPDGVKDFAICNEIAMAKNQKFLYDSSLPLISIFAAYSTGHYIKNRFNLAQKLLQIRLGVYAVACIGGLLMYCGLKDSLQMYLERKSDAFLCNLSPEFIRWGYEYYDKLVQRNLALRELVEGGEDLYKTNGDEIVWLHRTTPPTERRKFFAERRRDLN